MRLIARKPCSFGGKKYYIGDEIPVDDVINPVILEKQGVLVAVNEEHGACSEVIENGKFRIPVFKDSGGNMSDVLSVPLTEKEVQNIFSMLQMTVENAAKAVESVDSEDILIVLHATDNRASIKKAAQKRAEQLSSINPNLNDSVNGIKTTEDSTGSST